MTRSYIEHIGCLHPNYSEDSIEGSSLYRELYLAPAYGWEFATGCADARVALPVVPEGRDKWLWHAYLMRLNPDRHYNSDVYDAFHLSRDHI